MFTNRYLPAPGEFNTNMLVEKSESTFSPLLRFELLMSVPLTRCKPVICQAGYERAGSRTPIGKGNRQLISRVNKQC